MRVRVEVALKRGVMDPQGEAVARALRGLGFESVADVRQGKTFEIETSERDPKVARASAAEMARKLLANDVIENFRVLDD
jgi:phosphoribosylformylglycinamidine synthase